MVALAPTPTPNPNPNANPNPDPNPNANPNANPNPNQVASYILGETGCLTDEEFMAKYKHAASPHFDPRKHLKKMGLANQTTMYKKETQAPATPAAPARPRLPRRPRQGWVRVRVGVGLRVRWGN